jgi:hypothetical protein
MMMSILLTASAYAANPFLDAPDDRPVSAEFRGREWGENIPEDDIALSAQAVTTHIAKMAWGSIFKIEFTDLKSRAKERREITPEYFIVTDDRIALLNEADMAAALTKISNMPTAIEFEAGDIYGIAHDKFKHSEPPWETAIELKGDQCIYLSSHTSSGHFKRSYGKRHWVGGILSRPGRDG